jgi:NAD(P)-dependent dehydrogenase (short-subunit alcohol dehydrogenase family)
MEPNQFHNKIALITGAGSGIGQALAYGFAAAGATVIIADIIKENAEQTRRRIIENEGSRAFSILCDVSHEISVVKMVEEVYSSIGHIDILINNAAVVCQKQLVIDMSEEEWDRVININLKGTFLCSKHVGKRFVEKKSGVIINVGSITSKIPRWKMAPYSASKAAVLQFTRGLALEMAEYGVRVNAICPGGTMTPLLETSMARDGETSIEYRVLGSSKTFRSGIPLRRLADPDDHVGAALFLASDAARHITGQEIYIDGGESII